MPRPLECEFCEEYELVKHLFYYYFIVAQFLWKYVAEVFKIEVKCFDDVASRWFRNKHFL
jgi:hypothetical protein